jgi:hypothetical protein
MIHFAPGSLGFRLGQSVFLLVLIGKCDETVELRMGIGTVFWSDQNDLCAYNLNSSLVRSVPFNPRTVLFCFRQTIQMVMAALLAHNAPAAQDCGNPDVTR